MERLVQAGLFGAGLVAVDTPVLVARYNACLQQLGIEPTSLTRFRIDGLGWSPEIAREQSNNLYLCAGIANPMGVVISPNQRNKPVYAPFNSYDRRMLEAYFNRHHHAIADITATTYIGLDIDQELTRYQTPRDLLLVDYIVVRSVAGGLFDAAHEQRGLIDRFMADDLAWFDAQLRSKLIESATQWGDLRYRRIDIPDMKFEVKSFYTQAFGGIFVLRGLATISTLLVLEDPMFLSPRGKGTPDECAISDPGLPGRLLRDAAVEIDLTWYRDHLDVLLDKKHCLLADAVCAQCPELSVARLKLAQMHQQSARLADKLPAAYHEIERLSRRLESGSLPKVEELSPALRLVLMRPHRRLPESEQEVVWLLLCRLQTVDVVRLYTSDKNQFFSQYQTWTESKKEWVVELVQARHARLSEHPLEPGTVGTEQGGRP